MSPGSATLSPEAMQAAFAAALGDPRPDAVPPGFDDAAARRFRIYRNNVRVALTGALAAAYPAVRRLVGDAFFGGLAAVYAERHPALGRTLNFYGAGFADFVAGFPPARDLPYLADVARLERAVLESRHAADAPPLAPSAVLGLGATLATARLTPHPATRLVRSAFPVADIWHANIGDAIAGDDLVFTAGAAAALVVRPDAAVDVLALDPATCTFVDALLRGADIGAAHAVAVAAAADFDVLAAFRVLLTAGAFRGIAAATAMGN